MSVGVGGLLEQFFLILSLYFVVMSPLSCSYPGVLIPCTFLNIDFETLSFILVVFIHRYRRVIDVAILSITVY